MDGRNEKDFGLLDWEGMDRFADKTLAADGMVRIMDALIGEAAGGAL